MSTFWAIFENWQLIADYGLPIVKVIPAVQEAINRFPETRDITEIMTWLINDSIPLVQYFASITANTTDDAVVEYLTQAIVKYRPYIESAVRFLLEPKVAGAQPQQPLLFYKIMEQETENPMLVIGVISLILQTVTALQKLRQSRRVGGTIKLKELFPRKAFA